jgi:hypothetical protein
LQIGNTFSTEYSRVPLEQVLPFSFSGFVSNEGGAVQNDVALKASVSAPLFVDSSAVTTLNPSQSDSLFIVNTFTPNAIGPLNVTMNVEVCSDEISLSDYGSFIVGNQTGTVNTTNSTKSDLNFNSTLQPHLCKEIETVLSNMILLDNMIGIFIIRSLMIYINFG